MHSLSASHLWLNTIKKKIYSLQFKLKLDMISWYYYANNKEKLRVV